MGCHCNRRLVGLGALIAALSVLGGCGGASSPHATTGAAVSAASGQYLADAGRSGAFHVAPVRTQPSAVWSRALRLQLTPVAWGQVLYAIGDDGELLALNAKTGARLWQIRLPVTKPFQLAVDGRRIYIPGDEALIAVDLQTHAVLWRQPALRQTDDVVLSQGSVIGTSEMNVVRLDAGTGSVTWTHALQSGALVAAAIGDAVYATDAGGLLYCLDFASGQLRWQQSPPSNTHWETITGRAGVVLASAESQQSGVDGTGGELVRISPVNGESLWRAPIPVEIQETPAIAGDMVVVPGLNAGLFGVNMRTGAILWQNPDLDAGSPVITAGNVAFLYVDAHSYGSDLTTSAVDVSSGRELWHMLQPLGNQGAFTAEGGTVALADKAVFSVDGHGTLHRMS
jgi:outer membrane protein assembly factor BamB